MQRTDALLRRAAVLAASVILSCNVHGQDDASTDKSELLTKENIVDVAGGGNSWQPGSVGQLLNTHDRVRTGEDSRATVRLTNQSVLRVDELTNIEILPPKGSSAKPQLDLKQGTTYFFSREKSRDVQVQTPAANGAMRGTEFAMTVAPGGRTTVAMIDGVLELSNGAGSVTVTNGERADVEPGRAPTKTSVIETVNVVQWCLYYPGVLDLKELAFSAAERRSLASSLAAYEQGDLLVALQQFKRAPQHTSAAAGVYHAGLLLAVGQVPKAKHLLEGVNAGAPGRSALFTLIAAVTLQPNPTASPPRNASEWLAESYFRQSTADLTGALDAAHRATDIDTSFGFAWTRRAELEFSFGRVRPAKQMLEQGLRLASRNPAAYALLGFIFSAENNTERAIGSFEQAMAIDGALGDAWLGRGLCLIRRGESELGRRDLQTSVVLEPNRGLFHSYLGKAFSNVGNEAKANLELKRAEEIDPRDPTPWIYSAVEKRQENRVNEAVRDLEKSIELNNNRRVYRSEFLLDQDRAVRSANLAAIYQDAGMIDVSVREATRGVDSDYSNASSHLFLANSYNALRDPNRINLRYETPWFSELLLANLLAPVGGGPLSQYVSEQEYSKLFEADRFGISSSSNYYSNGRILETASQYGTYRNFSYSLDTEFFYDNGRRPNNEITRSESYASVKFQLTPQDTLFLQTKYEDLREGDLLQDYDQSNAQPGVHFRELQQPGIVLVGYHHQWAPGLDTLLLAGRLANENFFSNLNTPRNTTDFLASGFPNISRSIIFTRDVNGNVLGASILPMDLHYHDHFVTYTGELNQIWEQPNNTLIFGARFQAGEFHSSDQLDNVPAFASGAFNNPAAAQDFVTDLRRETVYLYDIWRPFHGLSLTAGVAYDHLDYPLGHRNPPISAAEGSRSRVSPKAGVIWNPCGNLVIRAGYARALGGVSFDESVQLEPTQVAGFNQVFRSIISESAQGSVAAPTYESAGLLVEDKLPTGTYLAVQANLLKSDVDRRIGVFDANLNAFGGLAGVVTPSSTTQQLRYQEETLTATVNQLLGECWSVGARYQVRFSDLQNTVSAIGADTRQKATLHEADLFALYNHPSGFFARVDAYWARQSNVGYAPDIPGDQIVQLNAYAGYRFRRNLGDITVGFLNITDDDYKLNPLSYYNELPRERTLLVRLRLNF